jgi:hypothetical protein
MSQINTGNYMIVKDGWKLIIPYSKVPKLIRALRKENSSNGEQNDENENDAIHCNSSSDASHAYWICTRRIREDESD